MENKRKTKRQPVDSKNIEELIKRYEFLIQSARDIILFIRHNDGRIIEANAATVKTYQYSLEELQSLTIYDLRAPETLSQVTPQIDAAGSQGILFETIHIKKNGENFPVEVSSQGTVMDGKLVLLSIIRDISERKKIEQKLQENESNLRALLNAVTESFFLMDKDGAVLAANETFAKRLGVDMDKLIGAIIYDLLSPDLAKLRKKQTENVISTGKPVRFEDIRNNRNIDQVIYPILNTSGQVVRMAVFGVDITQRREIEKQLETMALTDQLTGLYNRRGFVTLVERQL